MSGLGHWRTTIDPSDPHFQRVDGRGETVAHWLWRTKTMPPKSQQQRKAMWAAASGKSTLGIPRKVGKEFAESDPGGKLPKRVKKKKKR